MYYAVVDTNILVSAALAKDHLQSVPYAVFQGVSKHLFTPIVDENIVEEYYDVMSRSKFHWNVSYGLRFVDEILKYAINELLFRRILFCQILMIEFFPITQLALTLSDKCRSSRGRQS